MTACKKDIKIKTETIFKKAVYLCLFFHCFFCVVDLSYLFWQNPQLKVVQLGKAILIRGALVLCAGGLMLLHREKWYHWLFLLLFLPVSAYSFFEARTVAMFDSMFAALFLAKYLDYDKVIRRFYYGMLSGFAFVLATYPFFDQRGLLPFLMHGERKRYLFGFIDPNCFSFLVMIFVMLYLLKKGEKLRLIHCTVPLLAGVFIWIGPNSRSAAIIIALLCAALFLWLFLKQKGVRLKKPLGQYLWLKRLAMIALPVVTLLYFFICFTDPEWVKLLPSTFNARLILTRRGLEAFPITLLGQEGIIHDGSYFMLDSFYAYWFIKGGLLLFALFAAVFGKCVKKAFEEQHILMLIILSLFLIYAVSEIHILNIGASFVYIYGFARTHTGSTSEEQNGKVHTAVALP